MTTTLSTQTTIFLSLSSFTKSSFLVALLSLSLPAFAQEACEIVVPKNVTVKQFTDAQSAKYKPIFTDNSAGNKCFPHGASSMMAGAPLCTMHFQSVVTPVKAISATTSEESGVAEVISYLMRGTKDDVDAAIIYFNKRYEEITEKYGTDVKGPRFYGPVHVWKNGDRFIILGQNEPGYSPVDMSLQLFVGSKAGLENIGADLNKCETAPTEK